jgi:hypothetical protein
MDTNISKPMLTEPGIKYYLNEVLKHCHRVKLEWHNTLFNVSLLIFFLFILGCLLLYKYKGRLTPEEVEVKEIEKKHYILSMIKNFQDAKVRAQQELITGLPHWETIY